MTVFLAVLFLQFFRREKIVAPENKTAAKKTAPLKKSFRAMRWSEASLNKTNSAAQKLEATNEDGDVFISLSREQVEAYLLKNKRCAECLLNAFLETRDTNFLTEAGQNFPDNPLVQWTMFQQDISADEKKGWLEKLKISSPDNALPNYLSALDSLKAGNIEEGLAEINAARKKNYNSFDNESIQSREEMYLLAGLPPEQAKIQGMYGVLLPGLAKMKSVALEIAALQQKSAASGDAVAAQQLAALGVEASRKVIEANSPIYINGLVGEAMENIALKNLNAETYYDFLGKTAGERIQELKEHRAEAKELQKVWDDNFAGLSPGEKIIYMDRAKLYGEVNAMRWLKQYQSGITK